MSHPPLPLLQPSHIGEALVQILIQNNPQRFFELMKRPGTALHGEKVFREVKLRPYLDRGFDGASRVDVLVPTGPDRALPVEVKLGLERLTQGSIQSRFYKECTPSHKGRRWRGNMMAILEGLFPREAGQKLPVLKATADKTYLLERTWCLVVRKKIALKLPNTSHFQKNTVIVSFEDLAHGHGEEKFNTAVNELIAGNYYQHWFGLS